MTMSDGWERFRQEAQDVSKRQFYFAPTHVPGCNTIMVCIPSFAFPVGTVWFRFVGNLTIETMHSFVIVKLRRCGLRTALHERLLQEYPTVRMLMTGSGSDEGGEAWLRACGFKQEKTTGDWKLPIKRRARSGIR